MKLRTMQEWADFTGCYVAKNQCGTVHAFIHKPTLINGNWVMDKKDDIEARLPGKVDDTEVGGHEMLCLGTASYDPPKSGYITPCTPSDCRFHDYEALVEPRKEVI